MADALDIERFVQAQDPVIAQVRRELGEGRKRRHWMWFVFPTGKFLAGQRYMRGPLICPEPGSAPSPCRPGEDP